MRRSPSITGWRPTLIVFAREPLPGRTKRRLTPWLGARNAAALAAAFIEDAVGKALRVNCARVVIAGASMHPAPESRYFRALARRFKTGLIDQGAGSLGLRMARVLEPFVAGGALLIGSDTPSLPVELLARSLKLLRRASVVLGPSLDGGYYLVGARGAMPDIFRGIRWGQGDVLSRTIARLERDRSRFALGPSWYDVDRYSDLLLLAAHLRMLRRRTYVGSADPCPATARILTRLGLLAARR